MSDTLTTVTVWEHGDAATYLCDAACDDCDCYRDGRSAGAVQLAACDCDCHTWP